MSCDTTSYKLFALNTCFLESFHHGAKLFLLGPVELLLLVSIKKNGQQILFIAMVSGMQFGIATKHLAELALFAALLGACIVAHDILGLFVLVTLSSSSDSLELEG
eukprot:13282146-Ditylum_brightwellii.AAC.1